MNKIAILSAGPGLPEIVDVYGHSSDWIPEMLSSYDIEFETIKVYEDDFEINRDFDGYIITGSKYSVYDKKYWIHKLRDDVKEIANSKKPILGICFGHQLIADALGGEVCKNPKGWELGSYTVQLTNEGLDSPLFEGILNNEIFYESHQDVVKTLPVNSIALAHSEKGNQSFILNDNIYGVQFHPEFSWEVTKTLMDIRINKGIEVDNRVLLKSSSGHLVLSNFIDIIERRK